MGETSARYVNAGSALGGSDREVESTALAELALGPNTAAVRVDDQPADIEPEAQPLDLSPNACSVVFLEQVREILGRDTDTLIDHGDGDLVGLVCRADDHRGAGR